MEKHAKLSASSMGRRMACPASAIESEGLPRETSVYAEEGTSFAHWMEIFLKGESTNGAPEEFKPAIEAFDKWQRENLTYRHHSAAHHYTLGDVDELIEVRLGDDEFGGTPDYIFIDHEDEVIWVVDHKYGVQPVAAEANKQLLTYLYLLMRETFEQDISDYDAKLVIFQPNKIGSDELFDVWDVEARVEQQFNRDLIAIREGSVPNSYLEGDHCQFCPANLHGTCPLKSAKIETGLVNIGAPALLAPKDLTDEQLAFTIEHGNTLKKHVDNITKHAYTLLNQGKEIDGLKLVETKGNRKWIAGAEDTVLDALGEQAVETKVISPAKAEKLGVDVSQLVDRKIGTKVVLDSDGRDAVNQIVRVDNSDFTNLN